MIVHFYQVMKDCQTSLQCKYFFNHLIGFTQLPPSPSHTLLFSRSPTAINYIYRFSIYLLIRWRIERRQTDAHRSRGLFATSRPSRRRHCARLPSADGHHHCLRRTPERQVVHCANIFAFRLRFSLLSLLFFFIIFFLFFSVFLPQQEQPQELWLVLYICITVYMCFGYSDAMGRDTPGIVYVY